MADEDEEEMADEEMPVPKNFDEEVEIHILKRLKEEFLTLNQQDIDDAINELEEEVQRLGKKGPFVGKVFVKDAIDQVIEELAEEIQRLKLRKKS